MTLSSGNADNLPSYHPCFMGMIGSFWEGLTFTFNRTHLAFPVMKVMQHSPDMAVLKTDPGLEIK